MGRGGVVDEGAMAVAVLEVVVGRGLAATTTTTGLDSLRGLLAVRGGCRALRAMVDVAVREWLWLVLGGAEHGGGAATGAAFRRAMRDVDGWEGIECARALRTLERVLTMRKAGGGPGRRGRLGDGDVGLRRARALAREVRGVRDFVVVAPPNRLGWARVLENLVAVTVTLRAADHDDALDAFEAAAGGVRIKDMMRGLGINGWKLVRAFEAAFLPRGGAANRWHHPDDLGIDEDDDDMGLVPLPAAISAAGDVTQGGVCDLAFLHMLPAEHPEAAGDLVVGVVGSMIAVTFGGPLLPAPPGVTMWGATVAPAKWVCRQVEAAWDATAKGRTLPGEHSVLASSCRAPLLPNVLPLLPREMPRAAHAPVPVAPHPFAGPSSASPLDVRRIVRAFAQRAVARAQETGPSASADADADADADVDANAPGSSATRPSRKRRKKDPWTVWRGRVFEAVARVASAYPGLAHAALPSPVQ